MYIMGNGRKLYLMIYRYTDSCFTTEQVTNRQRCIDDGS